MESKDNYNACIGVVQQILCNSYNDETLFQAFSLLVKVLQNIVKNPNEEKFKSIKTSNATLQKKLFSVREVVQLLEFLGFSHVDDTLVLTGNNYQTIDRVANVVDEQAKKIQERNMTQTEKDELKRQKYLEERKKELEAENARKETERLKLKEQMENDKKEQAQREPARDGTARQLSYGATIQTQNNNQGGGATQDFMCRGGG